MPLTFDGRVRFGLHFPSLMKRLSTGTEDQASHTTPGLAEGAAEVTRVGYNTSLSRRLATNAL